MIDKIIKVFQYLLLSFIFLSCEDSPRFPAGQRNGYEPIYASTAPISFVAGQTTLHNPGKICRYKNYLLISEYKEGIHIFDNSNPKSPVSLGILKIAGNLNMEVSDSHLIVDYQNHLISLDLSDISQVKEISRARAWTVTVPPVTENYYICPDTSLEVIGWQMKELHNPKCYR